MGKIKCKENVLDIGFVIYHLVYGTGLNEPTESEKKELQRIYQGKWNKEKVIYYLDRFLDVETEIPKKSIRKRRKLKFTFRIFSIIKKIRKRNKEKEIEQILDLFFNYIQLRRYLKLFLMFEKIENKKDILREFDIKYFVIPFYVLLTSNLKYVEYLLPDKNKNSLKKTILLLEKILDIKNLERKLKSLAYNVDYGKPEAENFYKFLEKNNISLPEIGSLNKNLNNWINEKNLPRKENIELLSYIIFYIERENIENSKILKSNTIKSYLFIARLMQYLYNLSKENFGIEKTKKFLIFAKILFSYIKIKSEIKKQEILEKLIEDFEDNKNFKKLEEILLYLLFYLSSNKFFLSSITASFKTRFQNSFNSNYRHYYFTMYIDFYLLAFWINKKYKIIKVSNYKINFSHSKNRLPYQNYIYGFTNKGQKTPNKLYSLFSHI